MNQIQIRRGTTAEWAAAHPVVLAEGEPGYDTTLKITKIGDGITDWQTLIPNNQAAFLLAAHPVGSIYESTVSTSPATLFGGTWYQMGGTFLLGANETYAAGTTGGEATHTLTVDELASHGHGLLINNFGSDAWGMTAPSNLGIAGKVPGYVSPEGEGLPHNNMPPYEVVYRWKRTA